METLELERANGVLSITMNRPHKKNAANVQMFRELTEAFAEAAERDDDRVVIVTGAGGDFSAGADLGDSATPELHPLARMRQVADCAFALHNIKKPTIAKVDGVAVGAGCNLALGCDLVVASDRARFSEIFAKRGLSIDFGGSWLLPRRIGLHKAKELAFFADLIGADEAERLGLVNRVVPVAELDDFVANWAQRLAAGPPLALSLTKALLDDSSLMSMSGALESEGHAQAICLGSEDGREALSAFLGKREPHFLGR